jgi:hypothetical protein
LKSITSLLQPQGRRGWCWFIGLWSLLVFSFYFPARSLFDFSFLSELSQDAHQANLAQLLTNGVEWAKAVVVSVLVVLVFWRLGRRFWMWLAIPLASPTLRFCFETALGILFLNGLWLGLGLNGLWFGPVILVLGLGLSLWALWDLGRKPPSWNSHFSIKPALNSFFFIRVLILIFIGFDAVQALLPETYFDALVYHLSTLQFWGFHHGMADTPGNLYAHFPFGAELYLGNGFFLAGSQAAKLLNLVLLIMTSLAAGAWVAEAGSLAAGSLTTASILFLPLLSTTAWAAQNDLFVAFFILLFVYAIVKWPGVKTNHWFIIAGLMGGAAWSAKYTAVLGLGAVLAVWLLTVSRDWLKASFSRWLAMKFLILLALAPWLLKNYVFTGNPFYPYLSSWLGGQSLPPENWMALLRDHETPWVMNTSLLQWVTQVFTRDLDKTIAPLLLAFVPFLFLGGRWKGSARYLLSAGLFYLLLGFAVSHQLRLVIPAVVLVLTAMGMVLSHVDEAKSRSWAWVVLVFGLLSFISLARVGVTYYHLGEMATGFKTEKEYLETTPQTQGYFGLTEAVRGLIPPADRVLIAGDARSLYFPGDFYVNSVFDRQLLAALAQDEKDSEGIRRRLKELGIDDLAVSGEEGRRLVSQNPSYYPLHESEWAKLDDLIQRWTDIRFVSDRQGLYHLRETPLKHQNRIPDMLLRLNPGFQGKI